MARTPGIDVSRYQGTIEWPTVAAAGYRFAIIRATVGNYYTDPRFYENWRGAQDAGLLVSAYHAVKPGHTAASQIDRLFEVLESRPPDLPLVLDVELADDQPRDKIGSVVRECAQLIEQREGRKPILYTGKWFWDPQMPRAAEWAQYPLWIAHYGVETPTLPVDWTGWKLWQYSESGSVSGVSSRHTDLDWFNGSYEDLVAFCGSREKPAPVEKGFKARVVSPFLRVRSGPGVNYDYLGDLPNGAEIRVTAVEGKEVWVCFEPGKWAAMCYNGERYISIE